MDNSIWSLIGEMNRLLESVELFKGNIRHHVIIQPRAELEDAVRYGFPEDLYAYYMNRYYTKNVDKAEDILKEIEKELIPWIKDVTHELYEAVNVGAAGYGSSSGSSTGIGTGSSTVVPQDRPRPWPVDESQIRAYEQWKAQQDNNKAIEDALNIKQGPGMTIAEADKQNANPNHKLRQDEFIPDNNGEYVKVWNEKLKRAEYIDRDEWVRRGNDPSSFDAECHFKKNPSFQYSINCATCAAAYVLRLRGFDVKAKGNTKEDGNLNFWLSKGHSFDIWQNTDGSPVNPQKTVDWMRDKGLTQMKPDDYKAYFEETCKEKGVYILTLEWIDGGGHATILQRDEEGLHYIEPQEYDGRVKKSIDELIFSLHPQPIDNKGILRVDDKIFNPKYVALFDK